MAEVDVVLVTGACAAERRDHSRMLGREPGAALLPAALPLESEQEADPAGVLNAVYADLAVAAQALAQNDDVTRLVVDLPLDVPVVEAIGLFSAAGSCGRLSDVVCVVDVAHILEDLGDGEYLPGFVARALLTVRQIEFASVVVLANWAGLTASQISLIASLVSHLNPTAQLEMDVRRWMAEGRQGVGRSVAPGLRPGWVRRLNSEHPSASGVRVVDARVSTLRFLSVRPFHPGRLMQALDRLEGGAGGAGQVVRSAGFARLASRPHVTAQWEQVGQMFDLLPLQTDAVVGSDLDEVSVGDAAEPGMAGASQELLCVGQDLVLTGFDLDEARLQALLDAALLTDAEFLGGPLDWVRYEDPFPAWVFTRDRA